jgi:C-terminal processing protease CtpA/Prc
VISAKRARIVVPVATWQMLTYRHLRIAHLTLTDFTKGSANELRTEGREALDERAEVVGTETYGKGVFQVTESLINGGALDITVGKYFTPQRAQPRRRITLRSRNHSERIRAE